MLNPSVVDLLSGVAEALSAEVAVRLPPGPELDQVNAAVGIIRRVARTLPDLVPRLAEDTAALARALAGPAGGGSASVEASPEVADAVALVSRLPPGRLPTLSELTEANLALRGALAAIAQRDDLPAAQDAALRAELAALAEREAALRLSPWER